MISNHCYNWRLAVPWVIGLTMNIIKRRHNTSISCIIFKVFLAAIAPNILDTIIRYSAEPWPTLQAIAQQGEVRPALK